MMMPFNEKGKGVVAQTPLFSAAVLRSCSAAVKDKRYLRLEAEANISNDKVQSSNAKSK